MKGEPIHPDYIRELKARVDAHEEKLKEIVNNSRPTVPIYDWTNTPINSEEGQLAIMMNAPPVSLGSGLNTPAAQFYSNALTVATATNGTFPWIVDYDTVPILNLTTPTAPTFVADGLYAISTAIYCSSGVQASGSAMSTLLGVGFGSGGPYVEGTHPLTVRVPSTTFPGGALTLVVAASAGIAITLQVRHSLGTSLAFIHNTYIQQIG